MAVNPPSEDGAIEQQIQNKNLNAPRIKPEQIDALVDSLTVLTHRFEGTNVIAALALLPNGFAAALAMSAPVSAANFDEGIGQIVAISNVKKAARDKLWEFEGYALRKSLDPV